MIENDDDIFLDNEVEDIISQIKNQTKILKQPVKEADPLKKEDLENFVITNAGKIVNHSLEMVENLKLEVLAGADAKLIESVSELVKATTSAIESLSKLKLSDDKIKAQKEITQMNIDAKITKESDDNTPKLTFTRNDILKLLDNKNNSEKIVDI
jgi:hypothetical protein